MKLNWSILIAESKHLQQASEYYRSLLTEQFIQIMV